MIKNITGIDLNHVAAIRSQNPGAKQLNYEAAQ
jgi:hypothetical protein